jgi:predicted component of type VI protein secretion system
MKNNRSIQEEQQILYLLAQIVEAFPQYTISQHLAHILRKKSEAVEAYHWDNALLLKKFEGYYDELNQDLSQDFQNK